MTVLDYFVLAVVLASVASGAAKGILKGFISVTFALAGVVVAAQLYEYAGRLVGVFGVGAHVNDLIGFLAVFLLFIAAGSVISYALRRGLKRVRLTWADQVLGAGFGLLRGWLICSAIYMALTAFPVRIEAVERATFAPALLEGTRVIAYLTSRQMRERFFEGYATIKRMWERQA